jgi:hypothetical protein
MTAFDTPTLKNIDVLSETELVEVSGGCCKPKKHGHGRGQHGHGLSPHINIVLNLTIINITQIAIGNYASNFAWVGVNNG